MNRAWKIIPRPLLETVLNNHVQHHRVHQPLIVHGPRGVGKTTLIRERLLSEWNKGPHLTGYVDFAQSIEDYHPDHNHSFPWSSWSNCPLPKLPQLQADLENCLESMTQNAIRLGAISSHQILSAVNNWFSPNNALRRILDSSSGNLRFDSALISDRTSTSALWDRAVSAVSARFNAREIDGILGLDERGQALSVEEASYFREAIVALRLAKEVIGLHQGWRANAVAHLNRTGGFSRPLARSSTDWPCLLLELLSAAAEIGHFQPKLVINNIEVLRNAILVDDSTVCASQYHDILLWRIIALGVNEECLPVILVTSDSYYSYQAFNDFGFPDIFISRETFGWTPEEAKMHMVPEYFTISEFALVSEVLGSSPRNMFELYALKKSKYNQTVMGEKGNTFEDIVDAYLAHLQVTVVNPAMERALSLLQKFALDALNGHIPKDRLRFGAPWRHPPHTDSSTLRLEWAKLQLMDFVDSLANAEFGINYLADCSFEIFDDPSAVALIEVGLLYVQRDPPFIRPVSRGIQRCLARWLVQERLQLNFRYYLRYLWQRNFRGRSYRHLMLQIGYK